MERFYSKCKKLENGCIEWIAAKSRYGLFKIKGRMIGAHRMAWILKNGPIPPNLVVRHKCDMPLCVNVDHLEIGTQQDNIRDRDLKGHTAFQKGILNGHALLNDEKVRFIKLRNREGVSNAYLAKLFGVDNSTISDVIIGRTWKHIKDI